MDLKALHKISYGLYIITSRKDGQINGQIANTVFQISSDPPTVAVSINKQNLTNEFIRKSKVFGVSILAQEAPLSLIGQFGFKSGRDIDKFKDINYKSGTTGCPVYQIMCWPVWKPRLSMRWMPEHTIYSSAG